MEVADGMRHTRNHYNDLIRIINNNGDLADGAVSAMFSCVTPQVTSGTEVKKIHKGK